MSPSSLNFPFRSLLTQVKPARRPKGPLLLLDIDGVLAPFHSITETIPQRHITTNPYMNWTVTEETINWMNNLHAMNVSIKWASTWEGDSNLFTRALDLPDTTHLTFPQNRTDEWMKLAAVRKFVYAQPTDQKILWIDDEIDDATRNWASTVSNLSVIIPDGRTGMTTVEMDAATSFLTGEEPPAAPPVVDLADGVPVLT